MNRIALTEPGPGYPYEPLFPFASFLQESVVTRTSEAAAPSQYSLYLSSSPFGSLFPDLLETRQNILQLPICLSMGLRGSLTVW